MNWIITLHGSVNGQYLVRNASRDEAERVAMLMVKNAPQGAEYSVRPFKKKAQKPRSL